MGKLSTANGAIEKWGGILVSLNKETDVYIYIYAGQDAEMLAPFLSFAGGGKKTHLVYLRSDQKVDPFNNVMELLCGWQGTRMIKEDKKIWWIILQTAVWST